MEKVTLQTEPAGRTPAQGARAEVEQVSETVRVGQLSESAALRRSGRDRESAPSVDWGLYS